MCTFILALFKGCFLFVHLDGFLRTSCWTLLLPVLPKYRTIGLIGTFTALDPTDLCVYVYVCIYVRIRMFMYVFMDMCTHVCKHGRMVRMFASMDVWMLTMAYGCMQARMYGHLQWNACTHVCMYLCRYACAYLCHILARTYFCTYVCMYICMHVCFMFCTFCVYMVLCNECLNTGMPLADLPRCRFVGVKSLYDVTFVQPVLHNLKGSAKETMFHAIINMYACKWWRFEISFHLFGVKFFLHITSACFVVFRGSYLRFC